MMIRKKWYPYENMEKEQRLPGYCSSLVMHLLQGYSPIT